MTEKIDFKEIKKLDKVKRKSMEAGRIVYKENKKNESSNTRD